jgi:hypothetical protein
VAQESGVVLRGARSDGGEDIRARALLPVLRASALVLHRGSLIQSTLPFPPERYGPDCRTPPPIPAMVGAVSSPRQSLLRAYASVRPFQSAGLPCATYLQHPARIHQAGSAPNGGRPRIALTVT